MIKISTNFLPFIVGKFVAMAVHWDDINQKNILCLWFQASHPDFTAGKHPSVERNNIFKKLSINWGEKNITLEWSLLAYSLQEKIMFFTRI